MTVRSRRVTDRFELTRANLYSILSATLQVKPALFKHHDMLACELQYEALDGRAFFLFSQQAISS